MNGALRVLLLIGFLCLALLVYFAMLAQTAIALLRTGTPAAVALGVGVLGLPVIGAWVMLATLRAGLSHQRLARLAESDGMDLDVSGLPRTPSGRIDRVAADELFSRMRTELEADPENWQRWYRVARAYDYAGDRGRAREAMRRAVELERR